MNALLDKQLLVVAGKGGVGRTTIAAAIAMQAANAGKRVLLAQSKSKERLSALFECRPVDSSVQPVRQNLYAVNMIPQDALREYGTMVLKSELLARTVLENKVTRAFLRAVPGLEDYSMLGKVWFHTTEKNFGNKRWDLVVFDGPATGHMLTLLDIPRVILSTVPEGPLSVPARACKELLEDPARTATILVTLAEDLPSNEAVEFYKKASALSLPMGALVVNMLYPNRFVHGASKAALDAIAGDAALAPLVQVARTFSARRALNESYLERLQNELPLPQIHVPLVFANSIGPAQLERVSEAFA